MLRNVVLIVLDAARAMSFGVYGCPRNTTPEIDQLAAQGIVFERAYTPAVYTLGAMRALWTSAPPPFQEHIGTCQDRLERSFVDELSVRGIMTAGFVSNPMAGKLCGFDSGFVEFTELKSRKADEFRAVVPEWLTRNRSRRFFLYLHFREPHAPFDPPAPFDTLFSDGSSAAARLRGRYEGTLAFADQEVGHILHALQAAGLWDSTVVIVTADHGEEFNEHGLVGHGDQLFDETTHIPLIVRVPKGPRGRVGAYVDLLDVAPTIAGVFGARLPKTYTGKSLLPPKSAGKPFVVSQTVRGRPRRLPIPEPITHEQCEGIKALGYVNTSCQ